MEPTSTPITAAQVPGLLLEALPSLRDEWPAIEDENADPDGVGGRLGYLDAAWFVGHLADRLAAGETSQFDAAFDLIELLISRGDAHVAQLAIVGCVEGLQSETVTARGVDPQSFSLWLRPRSARYWKAEDDFWAEGAPIPRVE